MPKISVKVIDKSGKEVGKVDLSEKVFGITPNKQAQYDALKMQMASLRQGNADTKERSEVAGGGKKPYKQKGTGKARAGHARSPIWVGGGTVFGPTPRSYQYHINKKVSALAIRSLLSEHQANKDLVVMDSIEFENKKTKDFVKMMNDCKFEKKTLFVVADDENWANAYASGANLQNVMMLGAKEINPLALANADTLVVTKAAVKTIEEDYE